MFHPIDPQLEEAVRQAVEAMLSEVDSKLEKFLTEWSLGEEGAGQFNYGVELGLVRQDCDDQHPQNAELIWPLPLPPVVRVERKVRDDGGVELSDADSGEVFYVEAAPFLAAAPQEQSVSAGWLQHWRLAVVVVAVLLTLIALVWAAMARNPVVFSIVGTSVLTMQGLRGPSGGR